MDLALVKAVQDRPLWNLELCDQVWYGNTKAAVEYVQNTPGSSEQPAGTTMTVAILLPTAQTYKQTFKNTTMAFHTELETVSRKFPEISKFSEQTWLPPPEVPCTISTQPSTQNKSDYFSLKSSISHLSPVPKASHSSMLEQYFHSCFSSSNSTL